MYFLSDPILPDWEDKRIFFQLQDVFTLKELLLYNIRLFININGFKTFYKLSSVFRDLSSWWGLYHTYSVLWLEYVEMVWFEEEIGIINPFTTCGLVDESYLSLNAKSFKKRRRFFLYS